MAILSRYRTLSTLYLKINENNRYTLLYSGHAFYILGITVRRKSLILKELSSLSSMSSQKWRVGGVRVEIWQRTGKNTFDAWTVGKIPKVPSGQWTSGHLETPM